MTITIKEVAKRANVSISTVSRVINGSKPVSDDVKKRVLEVIRETGYTPNPVARSLVMKKSRLIGVIIPDVASFYIGEVLSAIEEISRTYDYDIILCNSYGEIDQELKYMEVLKSKQVEGIIFFANRLDKLHEEFIEKNNIPVVMVNRCSDNESIYSVTIDHFKAVYDMTTYLIENGHKKIALIRNGKSNDVFGIDQLEGYKKALEEKDIDFNKGYIFNGNFQVEKAYQAVEKMIKDEELPTVIFATSDNMSMGVLNCLYDYGYEVPKDISVVGYYDTRMSVLLRPKLTTVSQPIYDMGAIAVRLLIKKIKGEKTADNLVILPHSLTVRDSCRKINEE